MDITASILAATGTRAPQSYRPDGIDIFPMLRGAAPTVERRVFWRTPPVRSPQWAVRSGRWKLVVDGMRTPQFFLYDLPADPGERNDLAAQRPDLVRSLWRLLQDWEKDVNEEARKSGKTAAS